MEIADFDVRKMKRRGRAAGNKCLMSGASSFFSDGIPNIQIPYPAHI